MSRNQPSEFPNSGRAGVTSFMNNVKLQHTMPNFAQSDYMRERLSRRVVPRAQRPTELISRHRSESPSNRRIRPVDPHLSPSPSSYDKYDLDVIRMELEKKNGVLKFGNETVHCGTDDFCLEGFLGSGTCGHVHLARHRSRPEWVMAVKQMRPSSNCQEENKRIIKDLSVVTKSYDCPHIVECFGIFITASEVWICMEVMSTSLDKLLKNLNEPLPEIVIGKISVSIIKALDFLKEKYNVMHRDVKPSNMLLSNNGVVKLCDFGISGELKDSIARSRQMGCIGYMAPERLQTTEYDVRADIWSLGISLIELATGEFPYKGSLVEFTVMIKILQEPSPSLPRNLPFSDAFVAFVDLCLLKDPSHRPKYRQLVFTDFYRRHHLPPLHVGDWYRALPYRSTPGILPTSSSASSGYGSNGSDSSPGSLGSQSRSPSTTRTEGPGPHVNDPNSEGSGHTAHGHGNGTGSHQLRPLPTIPQGSVPSTGGPTRPHRQRLVVIRTACTREHFCAGGHASRHATATSAARALAPAPRSISQPPPHRTWVAFETDL